MYYHVRIDYYDKKLKVNQTLYEYDYSTEDELMKNVLIPYLTEKRILFSGVFLNIEDRRRLCVYETDSDIKSMVIVANKSISPDIIFVYDNEELVKTSKYAKDVTKDMTRKAISSLEDLQVPTITQAERKAKQPLLFISHASADDEIVAGLVEMLRTIGFNKKNLFCSSVPGYDIPEGEDIYDFLCGKLINYNLFVVFVLSEAYYNSAACLNEMGAAWVLKANYSTIILPGFQIPDIKGAVNPRKMAVVLEDSKRGKGKLTQLKDRLIEVFGLPKTEDDIIWENDRDKFIDIVNASL